MTDLRNGIKLNGMKSILVDMDQAARGEEVCLPLSPPDFYDPVIEAYKKDLDLTLLERNLRLTTEQRAQQLVQMVQFIEKFRPIVAAATGGRRESHP